jgi:PAS domain S-box-containing protein
VRQTPRAVSFCGHAICGPDTFVVADAAADVRFADNPLVTGAPHIRFYAGQPLRAADGSRVGTLCLIDRRARGLSAEEVKLLQDLAGLAEDELHVVHAAALEREVEQRRQAQRKLKESEELYRDLLENANDLIHSVTPDGRLLYVNRAWREVLGYSEADIPTLNMCQVVHPGSHRTCVEALERVVRGETVTGIEAEFLTRDGRRIAVEGSSNCKFIDGKPAFARGVFRDVTARKRAEQALAERGRLAAFAADVGGVLTGGSALGDVLQRAAAAMVRHLDAAFARIWTLDEAGAVLELKASAGLYTHLDGAHARVPVGKYKIGRIAKEGKPHLTNAVRGDPLISDPEWAEREGMTAFAGHPLIVQGRVVGVMAMFARHALSPATLDALAAVADGIAVGIERLRAEEGLRRAVIAAEAANRAKSEFLANTGHELRTPLNAVIGFANILLKNRRGNLREEELNYTERIRDNGRHLLALIDQILDLARAEAGAMELHLVPVALDALIRGTVAQLEEQPRAEGLTVAVELPADLAPLPADAARLRQVLLNLIGNALKFTERGQVTVRVGAGAGGVPAWIEVSDTGIGIAPDKLESIFIAFEQGDNSTARRYGGTGLGLAVARSLCELMGYRIEVESRLGVGSTFRVVLSGSC